MRLSTPHLLATGLVYLAACADPFAPVVAGAFALPPGTQAYVSARASQGISAEEWVVGDTVIFLPDGSGEVRTTIELREIGSGVVSRTQDVVPITYRRDGDDVWATWRYPCARDCAATLMTSQMKLQDGTLRRPIGAVLVTYVRLDRGGAP